jgi:membrane fusion protein (multidrug efflux system)
MALGNSAPKLPRLVAILCTGLMAACGSSDSSGGASGERRAKVETYRVEMRDLESKIDAVGSLTAGAQVDIRPQVDGILAAMAVTEGQRIEAGAPIAHLDASKAEARLALATAQRDNARAKLVVARQNFERARQLASEDLVSTERYQMLEAEFRAAEAGLREGEAQVGLAARQLEDFHITAPFPGTIGQRLIDVGSYVERGDALTTLIQDDPLEVRLAVPERYTRTLILGTDLLVADTTGEVTATGKLTFIDPRVTERNRMRLLKGLGANADGRLRPGQFVDVTLLLDETPSVTVIPEEAVVSYAGDTWVFVVEAGHANRRRIVVGGRSPGEAQILDGLEEGETIVVVGQHRLVDGGAVEVTEGSERAERLGAG